MFRGKQKDQSVCKFLSSSNRALCICQDSLKFASVTNDPQSQWFMTISISFSLVLYVHHDSGVTLLHTIFTVVPQMMGISYPILFIL